MQQDDKTILTTDTYKGVTMSKLTREQVETIIRAARREYTYPDFEDANLAGLDLSGLDLDGANLAGANLTDVDLTSAVLTCAVLADANLANANLEGANLTRAILPECYQQTNQPA